MFSMIAVSFTLKGQSFEQLQKALEFLKAFCKSEAVNDDEEQILVNAFMPKHIVIENGFPTYVVDGLAKLWPTQINCYSEGKPQRKKMANILVEFGGSAYVIGEIVEGVKEEIDLYKEAGISIFQIPLDWDGDAAKVVELS